MEQNLLISDKQTEYFAVINKMFNNTKTGSLTHYFKLFLLEQQYDEWWSQPQAQAYCNVKVAADGGVNWNTTKGGKKNPDGTPTTFGDPGRTLEKIRTETYDECWDNQSGKKEGPFRLNIEKYGQFTGSTKCHTFTEKNKKEILKRANGKCELCGFKGKLEIDHFIPREKGGESTLANGNALCSRCNDRKCNKDPHDFMLEEYERFRKYFTERGLTPP
jgi:hypothetical protein